MNLDLISPAVQRRLPCAGSATTRPGNFSAALLTVVIALLSPARLPAGDSTASPAEATAEGLLIGDIIINNRNIFNLDDPRENNALFRTANLLHIRTRPRIIRRQLLFRPGDAWSRQLADESERILRSNGYLEAAQIRPVARADGKVDVHVNTVDVWTLTPRIDFGRSGGVNTSSIGFEEDNLAGTGISLSLLHNEEIDRDEDRIRYEDRQLGNTRYRLAAAWSESNDGDGYELDFGLPFFALDSRTSHGLEALQDKRIDTLYDRGEEQAEFRHEENRYALSAGFSRGLRAGRAVRYSVGLAFEEHRFAAVQGSTLPVALQPDDRRFVSPFIGLEMIEDDYRKVVNHDQIGRVEDIHMGTRLALQLGFAARAFDSLDDALLISGSASRGFGNPGDNSLHTTAELGLRWQDDTAQNLLLRTGADWFYRHSPRRLLYGSMRAGVGAHLDIDNPLYLGGDTGLRGYPVRYQGGERSLLFTVEERYFTSLYLFRLFRIGGAVFVDAGRTWGDSPTGGENLGWLTDAGLGLRIGNNRTGTGKVIHVDLAFPLDGADDIDSVQFLVEARSTF